jgi:dipeptidyl aminopeptidase/acylaminoacyl peptidase
VKHPADLRRQVALGEVALSPDGRLVAYTRRTTRGDRDRCAIWLVPYAGGRPRRLTTGAGDDRAPRFAPDGSAVAFLSDRGDGCQLYAIPVDGGEAEQITSLPRGVVEFDWHPDGRRFVVVAEDEHTDAIVGARPDGEPTARVIRRLGWRYDGVGLTVRAYHLHVVPRAGGRPRRLTSGAWSASSPRVAPDGATVAFLADLDDDADRRVREGIHLVPLDGGEPRRLPEPSGHVSAIAYEADGTLLCRARERFPHDDDDLPRLYRLAPDGPLERLEPGLDDQLAGTAYCDLFDWAAAEGRLTRAITVDDDGRMPVVRDGEVLLDRAHDPVVAALAEAAGRVVGVISTNGEPPEVCAIEHGAARPLTRDGTRLRAAWPQVGEFRAGGITCFVVSPAGAGDEPRATILAPHGGPTFQWPKLPSVESLLLAHAGYRVLLPNPPGSTGRGRAFVRALRGDWGGVDAAGCHAVLDHAVAAGLADPSRLGVVGLSYGGFLANWLVGTSDRFAAAVSENGVVNNVSAWAGCDVGPTYSASAGIGEATTPEGVEALWRQSPLRHVANVRTPLLILQGEADHRCPPGDSEQFFVALRALGRDVEYVLYPESSHEFASIGRPDRRVDRQARVLAWFARWMPA